MPTRSHVEKKARITREIEDQRRKNAATHPYGYILFEKTNKGKNYKDYYDTTWKLKTGKSLNQRRHDSWSNMHDRGSEVDDTDPFINDKSVWREPKKGV